MPGIEVVMTRRPDKKKVEFKEPVEEPTKVVEPPRAPEVVVQPPPEPEKQPVLPYRNVPEIIHRDVPRVDKENEITPARVQEPIPLFRKEKAYKLKAPIEDLDPDESLFDAVLKTKIMVELGKLVKASPELAVELRKATTRTRRPLKHKAMNALMQESEFPYMEDDIECHLEYDAIQIEELPCVDSMYISTEEDHMLDPKVKAGHIIVPDPYLQYLNSLGEDEVPRQVFVASESASLRCIFPLANGRGHIEAVIDSGSQIVSMSLVEAENLDIGWDPDVQIYMQSASGALKKSAGLARNVPFVFGEITVYLQVHIIDQPAYKLLLGRPFDILTESQIKNHANGSQSITLKDPNTKKRSTLPTHARGTYSTPRRATEETQLPSLPQAAGPSKQSEFKKLPKPTVEEVRDEDDPESDSDEDEKSSSDEEEPGFQRSSRN